MNILTIIGARPQFIKAAAVSRAIQEQPGINETIVHTGQHFDDNMSKVFFEDLNIPVPAFNLDIHSLQHGAMTGRMLEQLEKLMLQQKPDVVLVYGDTNSTLAGALAASKLHIPVAHVEAGLRSFNMQMPEEINRILTDRVSRFLFCPTSEAITNLEMEGFSQMDCHVINTGDVMYDAALYYSERARKPLQDIPSDFILATLHRAENTDAPERLLSILEALQEIGKQVPVLLPLHPRTAGIIKKLNIETGNAIQFLQPQGYLQMIYLLKHCQMVMTDSGGLQKEAYFFSKPCITLRTETEWVELTRAGINKVAGFSTRSIMDAYADFRKGIRVFPDNLYGDGKASEKIIWNLKDFL